MSYTVKHLNGGATFSRPRILLNDRQQSRDWQQDIDPAIETLHKQLPEYGETKLHSLPSVASELGFRHVFVKDESTRFGLPSFKILGASWAIHRTLCKHLGLPGSTTLEHLTQALKSRSDIRLVTCTEGNWGRACARMCSYLGIPVTVYVPYFMGTYTIDLIQGEGAEVKKLENGSYDDCVAAVRDDDRNGVALMLLDTSWEGFTEIPRWVTDGYSTMLRETDRQILAITNEVKPVLVFSATGCGSWSQAVVEYYKAASEANKIVTVEESGSASFKESLHCGAITAIATGETIMNGMNCGTTSMSAWPSLRDGAFAAVTVTDEESHECVQFLQSQGVDAGPCGAATLAALKSLCASTDLGERREVVVVLFSTEGGREYEVPN